MSEPNTIRRAWNDGRPAFGVWMALPGSELASWCTDTSADYVCIDQQHGLIGYQQFVRMCEAVTARGVSAMTRVPSPDPAFIGKVLDAGARGVVVPMVETPEQAAAVVQACRYPPHGVRSFGPVRAVRYVGTRDTEELGRDPVVMVMIESQRGLANAEAITAVDGVDGVYIGPADLAIGLGLPPGLDKNEPEHVAAVTRIRDACLDAGKAAGIQCSDPSVARRYAEEGFTFVTTAKDTEILQKGIAGALGAARGTETDQDVGYA